MRLRWLLLVPLLLAPVGCGDDDSADPTSFCTRLDRLTRNDPFLAFGDRATPQDIQVAFAALLEQAEDLVEVAPDEARAAARDFAESAEALDSLLAGTGYDGTAVDVGAYRQQQTTYANAAERLERYLDAEC